MDQVALVENQIDDGQRLLDQLAATGFLIRTACWVKPIEEDWWSLYIASPTVDEKGPAAAYGQVIPVVRSLEGGVITASDLKLVGEKHPIVQDALELLRLYPHRSPMRPPRPYFGGVAVDEVYVYAPGKTEIKLYHIVYPNAPDDVSGILSLDPSLLEGHFSIEVERDGNRKVYEGETGINCVVAAPEGAKLERDDHGRMMLAWELHGKQRRSNANEVWALADLGLHGFRFRRESA